MLPYSISRRRHSLLNRTASRRRSSARSDAGLSACETLEDRTLLSAEFTVDSQVVALTFDDSTEQLAHLLKVDSGLAALMAEYQTFSATGGGEFLSSNSLLQVADGMVIIDAVASDDVGELLDDLQELGLQQASVFSSTVSGWLPIDALDDVNNLESLQFVSAAYRPWVNVGDVTSQGDVSLNADDARTLFGVDGSGVTIGVLSDSFDTGAGSYAADVDSGDLPAGVNVLEDSAGGTDEGRAMLQLIHDVAPGADLAFHTAVTGQAGFANGILDLANIAGADVIVDDIIYFAEPMFQDGIIAQAVDTVDAMGVTYFSSAGNADRQSYESAFVNSGELLTVNGEQRGELHDFNPDPNVVDVFQSITIPFGSGIILSFQWANPYFSVSGGSGATHDLDIYIVDAAGEQVLAESITRNIGGDPVEVLQYTNFIFPDPFDPNVGKFNIMISGFDGPDAASLIKYVRYDTGPGVVLNEYDTASSTLYGHANAAGAVAVGAAYYGDTPEFGQTPPLLEPFSSAGSTPILFDTAGNLLPTPEVRQSPDIVAPDGTDTTFFGTDTDGNGFPNFFGTSAAAPHAAAVAALLLEMNPGLTPDDVAGTLESTALDMDVPGYDLNSGFGLIQADAALAAVTPAPRLSLTLDDASISEAGGTTMATLTRFGDDNSAELQVQLASSDTAEATVPTMVTIPAGAASVQFAVTAVDDDLADGTQSADITASAPGFFPGSRQLLVLDDEPQLIDQWAATVIGFSSEWQGDPFAIEWTAMQTLGEPDTFQYGDLPTAWAASTPDGSGEEYLTLGFETAVFATAVTIRETWNNGFVKQVEVRDAATGTFQTVSTATDPSLPGTPVDYLVTWPITDYLVDAVRITIDSNHVLSDWEEIDAVQLHGWTQQPSSSDVFAVSEITIDGTAAGSLADTYTSDNVAEEITEELYAGNKRTRLEHEWTFDVPAGASTTFHIEAYHNSSVEDFRVEYSLDNGSSWNTMFTVTKTTDDDQLQEFAFPQAISGTLLVRVIDTDRSRNESVQDTIFVDQMFVRSTAGDGSATPQVTVSATDSTAAEPGADTGEFTITRTGDTTEELVVFYTLTGTADNGTDYAALPLSVTIPAGSATAVVTVTPLDDGDAEGNESVILTLTTDPSYTLGPASDATVTILDDEISNFDDFATNETTVSGSATGTLTDTVVSDNVYEALREDHSRGKPSSRISFLEHRWEFNVTGGDTVTLFVEAHHDSTEEDFTLEFSTDGGGTWTTLGTITKTADDDTAQMFALPNGTSGPVLVRVLDTDRITVGFGQTDTVFVDQLFIRSVAGGSLTAFVSNSNATAPYSVVTQQTHERFDKMAFPRPLDNVPSAHINDGPKHPQVLPYPSAEAVAQLPSGSSAPSSRPETPAALPDHVQLPASAIDAVFSEEMDELLVLV